MKRGVPRDFAKFAGKLMCQSPFFNKVADLRPATLLKKDTLAQMFSYEFCEIWKNSIFHRTPPVAASAVLSANYRFLFNCMKIIKSFRKYRIRLVLGRTFRDSSVNINK